jgi:ribosomal protein L11 methyltransferase
MSWCALDILATPPERSKVATWLVQRTGQSVVEQEDGSLLGVAPEEHAGSLLLELQGAFGPAVLATARLLPEQDWSRLWRDGLGPRRIGRLLVTPSWAVPPAAETPTVVIDPQTAFGTGEHGSTRSALCLLDRFIQPGMRIVDLGSGSGILAISAIKLGARRALGVDLDPEAEPIARENAERNQVADQVGFFTGDAATLGALLGPAELVLSNILRNQNESLLPVIGSMLVSGGVAVFAGMEQTERDRFLAALAQHGFRVLDETLDQGWWGVAASPG